MRKTYLVHLHNVKDLGLDLITAMLFDEGIEVVLPATRNDDLYSIFHELGSQSLSDARGRANDKDFLVWERHEWWLSGAQL